MKTGWACGVAQIKTTARFENQVCVLVFDRSGGPANREVFSKPQVLLKRE